MRRSAGWSLMLLLAMPLLVVAQEAARLPLVWWSGGPSTVAEVKKAGLRRLAVPPTEVAAWRRAGVEAVGMSSAELARRRKLAAPKLGGRTNVASATRRPWIDANGWQFIRYPGGRFIYDLPAGSVALAAAEAFAYRADAVLRIAPGDLAEAGRIIGFLANFAGPSTGGDLPPVGDFTVVSNDSPVLGEVLNLLTRRNLMFTLAPAPNPGQRINIALGSGRYPEAAAADPSEFAQKIRKELGDENRSLRIYGTEVIICRLTGDGSRRRVHLINYSGREAESLRLRIRGRFSSPVIRSFGIANPAIEEPVSEDDSTEFTISRVGLYTVVDLTR